MCLRSSRYLIAVISLLVFLFAGQASVQGYVLCIAENGHAELEYSLNNSCSSSPDRDRDCEVPDRAPEVAAAENHCGPCLDIPAAQDFNSTRHKLQKKLSPQFELPVLRLHLPSLASARLQLATSPEQISPRVSPAILAHRTVVLLN